MRLFRKLRYDWLKLKRLDADRRLELFLSLAITFFAAVQLYSTVSNNSSTTQQTNQLIAAAQISALAANQNAAAATSFANSAHSINSNVDRAVSQLQAQALATEDVRQSSEQQSEQSLRTATDNARADLRAYIVTAIRKSTIKGGCDYSPQHSCVDFQFTNAGKTPAFAIKSTAVLKIDEVPGSSQDEENIRSMGIARYTGDEGSVLGNSRTDTAIAKETGPMVIPHCVTGHHGGDCGYSIYGLIQYKDIFGEFHETGFCTYFTYIDNNEFGKSCLHGNWIDKRPEGYLHVYQ